MKKILLVIMSLLLLCSCAKINSDEATKEEPTPEYALTKEDSDDEVIGVWLPIYELSGKSKTESQFKERAKEIIENCELLSVTDIFIQVRANCDSIYPSKFFPPSFYFSSNGKLNFDALKIFLSAAHKKNIRVHAWINPYRLSSDFFKENTTPEILKKADIIVAGNGKYLDPASQRVNKLVLSGIREILENYEVDGIHIDDYFYPATDEKIDENEYNEYLKSGGSLALEDFRRNTVSFLVSSIFSLVKSYGENKIFSVSPCADIDKNISTLYADVKLWCSQGGYADWIIPQIYFGFENSSMPFDKCLEKWKKLAENSSVRLLTGLAVYKAGQEDKYAGSGKNEWLESNDIIAREVEYLRKNEISGFVLFSYNYVFGNKNFTKYEVKNLKSVI